MAPRSIELVHPSTGEIVTTDHIVAIDESGTCNDSELFCISAVYCTRSAEAQLAEWMIEADMKLWKEKPDETQFGATDIPTKINKHPSIDWFAIVASDPIDRQQKAAAAITAAAYALIQPNAAITHRPALQLWFMTAVVICMGHSKSSYESRLSRGSIQDSVIRSLSRI